MKPLVPLLVCLAAAPAFAQAPPPAPAAPGAPAAAPKPQLTPPKLLEFVQAEAPPALAERGRVDVVLELDVDDKGQVAAARVIQPAGDGFDEAALEAAKKFRFSPGLYDGKPVPVRVTYKYKFVMKPVEPPPAPAPAAGEPPRPPAGVPFSGTVLKKGDRSPLAGVAVVLDEGPAAPQTATDEEGRFAFDAVPPGPHQVHLRSARIYPVDVKITTAAGKKLEQTYYVFFKERYSSTVRGARPVVETVETVLSGDEIKRIPGTQGDTIRAVQNLPGVARSPFGGGLLVVWGSNPLDTRTYVDGVYIPTLFHFGGLRSTVNSEIVNELVFRPGGYNVEYGRGTGGVVEIDTRKPRTDGYHGFAQLDLIDVSGWVEGKITKTLSFAAGLRRSTIDAWLPYVTPNNFQVVPTYWDYQLKLAWNPRPSDSLEIFAFGSDDQLTLKAKQPDPNLSGQFDSHIFYHRINARWQHRFGLINGQGGGTLTVTFSTGYDVPFQFGGGFGNVQLGVDVRTCPYNLRLTARIPVTPWLRIDAGLDYEGTRWYVNATSPASGPPREGDPPGGGGGGFLSEKLTLWTNHAAPFVSLNFKFLGGKLLLTPQARLDIYTWAGDQGSPNAYAYAHALFEPRLQARYQATKWMAVKLAMGRYDQPPDPTSLLRLFGNPAVAPVTSYHYVFGFDFEATSTLHIEADAFYKDLRNLVVRAPTTNEPLLLNDGIGRAYGAQFLVRQQLWKGLFGWVTYTVLRAERKDHPGDPWRLFQYDQTHILTLIASYKFGKGYQVGLRFRYVTGSLYTPVIGSYYDANAGSYRRISGDLYSQRLPDFHQLDVRFDKTWAFDRWRLSLYLDIQNLYNNRTPEGVTYNYNFTQQDIIAGLPIIPDLGLRGEF